MGSFRPKSFAVGSPRRSAPLGRRSPRTLGVEEDTVRRLNTLWAPRSPRSRSSRYLLGCCSVRSGLPSSWWRRSGARCP